MTTYTFPVLTFTATETVLGQDAQGKEIATEKTYEFRGVELPNGVVMVLHNAEADEFYENRDAVQAHGEAQVTGCEDSGVVKEFDADDIRAAVEASAREYGDAAIPEAMTDWLEEVTSASMPDGQSLTVTAAQARKVWQVWLALAPVAARRREGVMIAEGKTPGTIEITTVYAPQWEGVCVVVELSGRAGSASEQSAPEFGPKDLLTSTPPPAPFERDGKAPTGWHVTWAGSSVSDGPSFETVGFHPANEEECTAAYVVAPIAFVEEYERRQDPERQYPATRLEAVRAYARSQSWPCG